MPIVKTNANATEAPTRAAGLTRDAVASPRDGSGTEHWIGRSRTQAIAAVAELRDHSGPVHRIGFDRVVQDVKNETGVEIFVIHGSQAKISDVGVDPRLK